MTAYQRQVTLAIAVLVGMSLLMAAGLTFLVTPMAQDLNFSDGMIEDLLAAPSVAALLVVFSAGQLGDRIGHRRSLIIASVLFIVGSGFLTIAHGVVVVQIALILCAVSAVTMQIVGVGLLQQATSDGPAQLSAFTTYGMVFPLAFLVFPVGTAFALQGHSWRFVPTVWLFAGIAMLIVALYVLKERHPNPVRSEWVTPVLAGISLAALGRVFSEIDDVKLDPSVITVGIAVSVGAGVLLYLVKKSLRESSFEFTSVKLGMLPVLLILVALVSFIGLLTYVSIALEFLYDLSPYEAALALVPAQIGAVLGAKVFAKWCIQRWGGESAIRVLLLVIACTMLPLIVVQSTTPVWYLVVVATLFSFAGMATLTALNAEVMRRAPKESTGAVSAFRTASSSLGAALGVGVLGTIVISSVHMDAGASEVSDAQLSRLAASLRFDGVVASLVAFIGWLVLTIAINRIQRDHGITTNQITRTKSTLPGRLRQE